MSELRIENFRQKVNRIIPILEQAAAFRRGASELSTSDKKKLEELKKTLSSSGTAKSN